MPIDIVIEDNINKYKDIIIKDYPHFEKLYNSIYYKIAKGKKSFILDKEKGLFLIKEEDLYSDINKPITITILYKREAIKTNNNISVCITIKAFRFKDLKKSKIIISNQ